MAAVSSFSFSALGQSSGRKISLPSTRSLSFNLDGFLLRPNFSNDCLAIRPSNSTSSMAIRCTSSSSADIPTVAETKLNFLNSYKRPIPSIYNTVLQELIVQHHLMKYKKTFQYDAVFGLGFVTVYDQLMDGYQSDEDREAIFQAYIKALKEDPEQYRNDANRLEEWAKGQNASSLIDSTSKEGILKDIAERAAAGNGRFSYSRFFAIGLFRLLELANATDPTLLEKLCAALNINKKSVDRDLDVYRNLLSKLVQAKELLKEYVDREKKKQLERSSESQKASEAITKCLGEYLNVSGR